MIPCMYVTRGPNGLASVPMSWLPSQPKRIQKPDLGPYFRRKGPLRRSEGVRSMKQSLEWKGLFFCEGWKWLTCEMWGIIAIM